MFDRVLSTICQWLLFTYSKKDAKLIFVFNRGCNSLMERVAIVVHESYNKQLNMS